MSDPKTEKLFRKAVSAVKAKKGRAYGVKTRTINIYSFDELSAKAKEVARNWFREASSNDEWWDFIYEDAERIGLKITSFDLDRRLHAKGKFIKDAFYSANAILKEHGEDTETAKDAKVFLGEWKESKKSYHKEKRDVDGDMNHDVEDFEDSEVAEELEAAFLKTLLDDYARMLQSDSDYRDSDESIDENIRANDYEFYENGKIA